MRPNGAFRLSKESKRILARKTNPQQCNDTKRAFIDAELSSQQIIRREKRDR